MKYESVIGLEVHVQIKTESKLFCDCPSGFGADPNANICPVCSGYPGVLPVLNKRAVESLVKTALALDCQVREKSVFARKQYFYPDLPKNYQISQYEQPLAEHGVLTVIPTQKSQETVPKKKIGITRIHLEEDAGKLIHSIGSTELDYSLVDLNRTGIPLMEIVSEPEIRSPQQAYDYLTSLKTTLLYLQVSDCDMEKGSLRCDANISVRPEGSPKMGNRVELKNMNSFRGVRDAIEFEIDRQIRVVESNGRVVQETRLWDADRAESRPMRSKEEAHDYRYFPEPDLPPLLITKEWIESIRNTLPELPIQKKERFIKDFKLSEYDAGVITSDKAFGDFYEKSLQIIQQSVSKPGAKILSNWMTTELMGRLNANNKTLSDSPISHENIAQLVVLILKGTISGKIAKTVFDEMWNTGSDPETIVKEKNLVQVLDQNEIERWAEESLMKNPRAVEEYRNGKEKAIGVLVGSVMKISKGQANPELVNQILKKKLQEN